MKTVLGVGNCSIDHVAIERAVQERFEAAVLRAADSDEALELLHAHTIDLVLVNRWLQGNRADGVELVRRIKSDPAIATTPVMLLSDLAACQQSAIAAGAELGFGKSQLSLPETTRKLRRFLG